MRLGLYPSRVRSSELLEHALRIYGDPAGIAANNMVIRVVLFTGTETESLGHIDSACEGPAYKDKHLCAPIAPHQDLNDLQVTARVWRVYDCVQM
jgi:hypothetical protein